MISERKNSNRPRDLSFSFIYVCEHFYVAAADLNDRSHILRTSRGKDFPLRMYRPTHQARQKCWAAIESLFPASFQSNPSAQLLQAQKRIHLSLSNLLFTAHLPTEAFFVYMRCVLAEKRAVAQTSDQTERTKWPQNFSCRVHPDARIYENTFVLKYYGNSAPCHSKSIVFSFSLGRGAKSSFCERAVATVCMWSACFRYLHSQTFYKHILSLKPYHLELARTESIAPRINGRWLFLHKFVKCGREGDCKIMQHKTNLLSDFYVTFVCHVILCL